MKPYRDFSDYLAERFPCKMQKISVNAGFTCPNRDGSKGSGGCTYCNNRTFSPEYTLQAPSVREQLERGKEFFARKYPEMRYLAYFQSYTGTYGESIDQLMAMYSEALGVEGVDGLIIGTRPDCVPDELLERLARLPYVMIEFGAESSHDSTLGLINRCHSWADTVDAVTRTSAAGIPVGLHLIMGLPGETEEMMLETIDRVNELPVATVKFHQLQLIRGTRLAAQVASGELSVAQFTPEEYARLCARIARRLRPDIAIERFVSQSPDNLLISPRWGLKNYQFTELVKRELNKDTIKTNK